MTEILALMDACHEQGASDLHLAVGRPPVLRLKGLLVDLDRPPLTPEDTRAMAMEVLPERCKKELEECGSTDYGYAHEEKCRFRVAVLTQKGSVGIVMRLIPHKLLSFEQIGLPDSVHDLLTLHRGLVLVTGPTGSGKTTTLATMLDWVNANRDTHIITIEDPIEYYHDHQQSVMTQREVGTDVTSFGEAMRRALREDPDVILLGEMRDLETTSAAISAAETGHLVFGTLHTTGSARTVDRIIDQYPTDQQEQNPAIENHIRKKETFKIPSVLQTSKRAGNILLDDSLLDLYRAGRITKESLMERVFDRKAIEERIGGGA